jgi:hypothetical protein
LRLSATKNGRISTTLGIVANQAAYAEGEVGLV